jgi:hypothetical protein
VTVVPHGILGFLTIFPTGQAQPAVSTLNSLDGRIKANAATVPADSRGAISVFVTDTADVILDINGYFAPPGLSTLTFFPLTPCRAADTRSSSAPLGGPFLTAGVPRSFPVRASAGNVPSTAQAYSLNFTLAPRGLWAISQRIRRVETTPLVSTLNALTGQITANAGIVPAGANGEISVVASNDTDVLFDINGYFGPGGGGGLSLYTVAPCRVLDTRNPAGTPHFFGNADRYPVDESLLATRRSAGLCI